MHSVILDSLVGIPLTIDVCARSAFYRPANMFELPIVLTHTGTETVNWSQENALNLAYRWLTHDGIAVDNDGMRTALPVGPLMPGSKSQIVIVGAAPHEEGTYQLQLSLVLEGVHWACDVGSNGWTQIDTAVAPAPAWPTELLNSSGARAIRGALAAAELAQRVAERSLAGYLTEEPTVSIVPNDPGYPSLMTVEPEALPRGLRAWLRSAFGVSDLQAQVSDLLKLAGRQEQQTLGLEQQIVLLRSELGVNSPEEPSAIASRRNPLESTGLGKQAPR